MKAVRKSVAAAMALVLMAGGVAVGADNTPPSKSNPPPGVQRTLPARAAADLSMGQAVKLVERRYRARVVRAETQTQGDRTIYVLRMLDGAGRVFSVRVDAASGTIL
ncbi:MAG: PepSY domain-containing protein [Steroidobacteraceae bacterium]